MIQPVENAVGRVRPTALNIFQCDLNSEKCSREGEAPAELFFVLPLNVHKPNEHCPLLVSACSWALACERQVAAHKGSAGASPSRDRLPPTDFK